MKKMKTKIQSGIKSNATTTFCVEYRNWKKQPKVKRNIDSRTFDENWFKAIQESRHITATRELSTFLIGISLLTTLYI